MTGPAVLQTHQLRYAYPGCAALAFPDVALAQGEVLLLSGPSGSGKSTWLALVAALVAPCAGSVRVAGQDIAALRGRAADAWRARNIGFLPQKLHLSAALTVRDNLALAYWAAGMPENPARIIQVLEVLGVQSLAGRLPSQLSGGQAQREQQHVQQRSHGPRPQVAPGVGKCFHAGTSSVCAALACRGSSTGADTPSAAKVTAREPA